MTVTSTISHRSSTFLSVDPVLKALGMAVLASLLVQIVSKGDQYNVSSVYSGIFGLLSIFAGFLGTFFVFTATKSNKFLEAIQHTITFKQMLGLLRFTILWTLAVVVLTFAMMIVEPRDFSVWSYAQVVVFGWAWTVILIGVNFFRCVSMFFRIIDQGNG